MLRIMLRLCAICIRRAVGRERAAHGGSQRNGLCAGAIPCLRAIVASIVPRMSSFEQSRMRKQAVMRI